MASPHHHLALRDGAALETSSEGDAIAIRWRGRGGSIGGASPAVRAALLRLARAPVTLDELADGVVAADGWSGVARLQACLLQLERWCVLARSIRIGDMALATLVPCSRGAPHVERAVQDGATYALSRFACLRSDGTGALVLESPCAHARLVLHDPRAVTAIHALARPSSPAALRGATALPASTTDALLALLAGAGFAIVVDPDGTSVEDRGALRSWEPHDLWFHARSREGRHDQPSGATFRFGATLAPPPPLKPPMSSETIDLHRPDLARLRRDDPPFERVLADRRSVRTYGDAAITHDQLGALLYRAARVTSMTRVELGPAETTIARRPYPSAGALYELELYVAVARCDGLAPGLYHHDPAHHRLERPPSRPDDVEALLHSASTASQVPRAQLQTLIILAARFQRLAWKYASMAYAAILKDVGCALQTLYLVATAMELAPCAIGSGDPDGFARAAGTDSYEEASVGELLLGSAPQRSAARPVG